MIATLFSPVVRSLIRKHLVKGWSGRKIYSGLHGWGLPKFHRDDFFKVVKYEKDYVKFGIPTHEAARDIPFPKNIMCSEPFQHDSGYYLHGRMIQYSPETQQFIESPISMYDDKNRGLEAWEDRFMKQWTEPYDDEELILQSVTIDKVQHDPGYRY